jgi:hypothetical protein
MKTITRFLKRVFEVIRRFFKQAASLLWKLLALTVTLVRRGTFALPHDEAERLEVLHFTYKALNVVLVLAVLVTGVWLAEHGWSGWTAMLLLSLRLLYALPARRVERALRQHQYQDREKARAKYSRAKSA